MSPLKSRERDRLSYDPEISPSMIFRELERYHIDTIYDPLACTTGTTSYFKLQNLRVISNDQAMYVYVKGKALWENNHFTVPEEITETLTTDHGELPPPDHYKTLGENWLTDQERKWLEHWRRIINDIRDEYFTALVETAVCLVIDFWLTNRRFGESSHWTPNALLKYYIDHACRNLLDNEESNEMWREDPLELTDKVIADIMFFNPPPLKGYDSFGEREHILESWLRGMSDFPLSRIASEGTPGSSFDDKNQYMESLGKLMEMARHIPVWAVALSNRQPFTRLEFTELLKSMGRHYREIDLNVALQFFSRRAADSIILATR